MKCGRSKYLYSFRNHSRLNFPHKMELSVRVVFFWFLDRHLWTTLTHVWKRIWSSDIAHFEDIFMGFLMVILLFDLLWKKTNICHDQVQFFSMAKLTWWDTKFRIFFFISVWDFRVNIGLICVHFSCSIRGYLI